MLDSILVEQTSAVANIIRRLTVNIVSYVGSGHPGMPMGCAELLAYLYTIFMQYHPGYPRWIHRDRLILSAGHGVLGQLIPLHLAGYPISLKDLQEHRRGNPKTASHPQYNLELGIETSTGADGFGVANAVGIALGQKILAHQRCSDKKEAFNEKIIVIAGDGCMMEGGSYEAAQLAGHWKLNNFILIYDCNQVSLDGYVSETVSTDYLMLYKALGFDVFQLDGHDIHSIHQVLMPLRVHQKRPVLIIAHTKIGRGLKPELEGKVEAHRATLETKPTSALTSDRDDSGDFFINPEVYQFFTKKQLILKKEHKFNQSKQKLKISPPELLKLIGEFEFSGKKTATRFLSQELFNFLSSKLDFLYSGSADSAKSDGTWLDKSPYIAPPDYQGRNIKFGVREFAMASIAIGLAQTQEIVPVIGGFFAFSDYLKPALRFAALMKIKMICHFSHDSIFLGEDGPTHQPIEQLAMFRATPNTLVIRPADGHEVQSAWIMALLHNGPTILVLTRQSLEKTYLMPIFTHPVQRGAYVIKEASNPCVILYASGSEVELAIAVKNHLEQDNILTRVISVPCWELFEKQSEVYKNSILSTSAKLMVSLEAASHFGWSRFVGANGLSISVDQFGFSASSDSLREAFEFSAHQVTEKIKKKIVTTSRQK